MRYIKFVVLLAFVLFCGNALSALNLGDTAPLLKISEWVKGEPVNLNAEHSKKVYLIFFWSTRNNISSNLMHFISTEKKIYGKDGAVFIGISKEKAAAVKKFLKKYPDINFGIAVDDNAETYSKFMQDAQGTPMFFVFNRDKKLIWKGGPFEVDRVLASAMTDTFNAEKQKQIEEYREDIREASQTLNRRDAILYARKILKIDPTDRVAVNIIVDNYVVNGEEDKAIDFIRTSLKKAGNNKYMKRALYFLELSLIRGMNNADGKKKMQELAENYKKPFWNDPDALNSLVIVVIRDAPLGIIPLKELLDITKRSVALTKNNHDPELLGSCLQSQARVYYLTGWLDKAVSTQEKAVQLVGNTRQDEKDVALLTEAYYKEALTLNHEK